MLLQLTKKAFTSVFSYVVLVSAVAILFLFTVYVQKVTAKAINTPAPAISAIVDHQEEDAALDVAAVFGRSKGCNTADHAFVRLVAREALNTKVPPKVLASVIAVESQCNQYAVSRRGAIGYAQVMPTVWGKHYDFAGQYNLFNPRDNIHVGGLILADYIKQHGLPSGVQHYLGTGVGCQDCDPTYSARVLNLSNK